MLELLNIPAGQLVEQLLLNNSFPVGQLEQEVGEDVQFPHCGEHASQLWFVVLPNVPGGQELAFTQEKLEKKLETQVVQLERVVQSPHGGTQD